MSNTSSLRSKKNIFKKSNFTISVCVVTSLFYVCIHTYGSSEMIYSNVCQCKEFGINQKLNYIFSTSSSNITLRTCLLKNKCLKIRVLKNCVERNGYLTASFVQAVLNVSDVARYGFGCFIFISGVVDLNMGQSCWIH